MKTLWNESDRREIQQRISRLDAGARAKWGEMSAPKNVPLRYPPLTRAWGRLTYRHVDHYLRQFGA